MKKKIMILCLIVALTMLVGCGNSNKDVNNSGDGIENIVTSSAEVPGNEPENIDESTNGGKDISTSKLFKVMAKSNYYLKYEFVENGQTAVSEFSKDGENYASRVTAPEGTYRTVQKGDTIYTIMESQKMIMTSPVTEIDTLADSDMMSSTDETFTSGTETFEGKEYDYEDFEGTKFYFEGNDLKFITVQAENIILKVVTCEPKSLAELFDIPTDYTDYSSYMQQ